MIHSWLTFSYGEIPLWKFWKVPPCQRVAVFVWLSPSNSSTVRETSRAKSGAASRPTTATSAPRTESKGRATPAASGPTDNPGQSSMCASPHLLTSSMSFRSFIIPLCLFDSTTAAFCLTGWFYSTMFFTFAMSKRSSFRFLCAFDFLHPLFLPY